MAKVGRPVGFPKSGGRAKGTPNKVASLASVKLAKTEMTAEVVVESIRRGSQFDVVALFYAEAGVECYDVDGPLEPDPDVPGAKRPAWLAGDIKREWAAGDLKPIHEMTEAERFMIAGFELVMKNATAGDGKVDRVLKVKIAPRDRYVEMGAKYHALLVEKIEHDVTSELLDRLDRGRLRNAKK